MVFKCNHNIIMNISKCIKLWNDRYLEADLIHKPRKLTAIVNYKLITVVINIIEKYDIYYTTRWICDVGLGEMSVGCFIASNSLEYVNFQHAIDGLEIARLKIARLKIVLLKIAGLKIAWLKIARLKIAEMKEVWPTLTLATH